MTKRAALAVAVLSIPQMRPTEAPGQVVVQIQGVRNERGFVRVSLFRGPTGFPEDAALAVDTLSVPASGRNVEVRFQDVAAGVCAVAVLHDENENGRLDRNLLRIPREGVGASNDAARRGTPRFENARVECSEHGALLIVTLHYWR